MALAELVNYCNYGPTGATGPTGRSGATGSYYAVPQWAGGPTGYSAGTIVRQAGLPAVGSERCFVSLTNGTGSTGTEPTWQTTRGGTATDGTVLWMEATGLAGLNGDLANTPTWAQFKAAAGTPTSGQLIQANDGSSLQICQTSAAIGGAQPAFSTTPGVRTVDNSAVWISLGPPSNYIAWQSPHARLANACAATWMPFGFNNTGTNPIIRNIAGNGTVFVGDNHMEQQTTAITIAPVITDNGSTRILSVDHTVVPTSSVNLKAGAVVWCTGSANTNITSQGGNLYFYGIAFQAGSAALSATLLMTPVNAYYVFDTCVLTLAQTAAGGVIQINATNAGQVTLNNTSTIFGNAAQYIDCGTTFLLWQNSTLLGAGSVVPTTLFGNAGNARLLVALLEGVDMSSFTGQINGTASTFNMRNFTIKDCKLNTAATLTVPLNIGEVYQLINCEIGATGTVFKSSRHQYEATETTETSITRVGGAVDPAGNAQSRKIISTNNTSLVHPYRAEPLAIYNGRTGTVVTVNVYGTWTGPTGPNKDQIWVETEYLGTTGYALGVVSQNVRPNILGPTGPVWPTDNSTWNGGGSSTGWTPFVMSVGLTGATGITGVTGPQWGGLIHVRPRVGFPNTTFYIDPKIVLS